MWAGCVARLPSRSPKLRDGVTIMDIELMYERIAQMDETALHRRLEELDIGIADRTKYGIDHSDWSVERNAVAAALERLVNLRPAVD